jgi:hypothetical protein
MNSVRAWVYRVLVLIVAAIMVASFVRPWWTCHLHTIGLEQSVGKDLEVFAWGFRPDVNILHEHVVTDITPLWQVRLAWGYLAFSVVLALASTWLKGSKARWLLALVGLVYIVYAVAGILWIRQRTGERFGIKFQGYTYIPEAAGIDVDARVLLGYYLAPVSGALFVALALLRNLIVGKSALDA